MTDDVYMSLYHGNQNQTYITRRYSASGEKLRDYSMIENYWFPSLFVFPQKNEGPASIGSIGADESSSAGNLYSLDGVCKEGRQLWRLARVGPGPLHLAFIK